MAGVAEGLNQPPMPWQRLVYDVAGEIVQDPDTGIWVPAYPEVVITVPRQNGKTTIVLTFELDRALLWEAWDGKPQALAYSAQNGSEARKKFRKEHMPMIKQSKFRPYVTKFRLAAEDTGIDFTNNATFTIWNNSEDSGHGGTIDFAALDEIFSDEDNRREQAVVPAMATRHDRQKLVTSTAGTEKSVVLARKQANGRKAVEQGRRDGIAYFEWSADPDSDPEDPETWRSCMPALGYTITERTVQAALDEMRGEGDDLSEFKRAWLNIPRSATGEQVIPPHIWDAVTDEDANTSGRIILAADGTPDNDWGSVAAADESGTAVVVAHQQHQSWMGSWLAQNAKRHNAPVVIDMSGPVRGLADRLESVGVRVIRYARQDYAAACANFYNSVIDERVRIRSDEVLSNAVAAARRQPISDMWVWKRKDALSVISPLVALTLALDAATSPDRHEEPDPGLLVYSLD